MNNIFYNINNILERKYKEKNKEYFKLNGCLFNLHNFKSFHLVNNIELIINFLKEKSINYHIFDNQNYNDGNIIKLSENKSVLFISYDFIKKCINEENKKDISLYDYGTKLAYLKMALFQEIDFVVYGYNGGIKDFLSNINNEIDKRINFNDIEMKKLYENERLEHYEETNTYFSPSLDYSLIGQNVADLILIKEYLNSYDNYFNY